MKSLLKTGVWLVLGSFISIGCAKRTWIKDLSVAPGTSMEQGQEQIIRFVKLGEVRDLGQKVWLAGKGYAQVNGGSGAYFWKSSTPPQLEVEAASVSQQTLDMCKSILKTEVPKTNVLALEGKGFFKGTESPQGFLGIFKLESLTKCEQVPAD